MVFDVSTALITINMAIDQLDCDNIAIACTYTNISLACWWVSICEIADGINYSVYPSEKSIIAFVLYYGKK